MTSRIPEGWHGPSHQLWLNGNRMEAIQGTINTVNTYVPDKPLPLVIQLAYYLFLINDYQSAATVLRDQLSRTPDNPEVLLNLAVCLRRTGQFADAVRYANQVLELAPKNTVAYDVLAACYFKLGHHSEASTAGTQSLILRDQQATKVPQGWCLPPQSAREYARSPGKRDVIAFSLWGQHPRYLRGAVQNTLLAQKYFPGWQLRFYVDEDFPQAASEFLTSCDADVVVCSQDTTTRQKLCRRFQVANDPAVGHFLVRDVDSVFSARERAAVDAWLESDDWFHVIRDWWSHTDLILAGMWGGVAGVLPSLSDMYVQYDSGRVETPNIDQWFLRDRVWPYIRESCLVHDRCFRVPHSSPTPGPTPAGDFHIGQDEFAVRRTEQEQFIMPFVKQNSALLKLLAFE